MLSTPLDQPWILQAYERRSGIHQGTAYPEGYRSDALDIHDGEVVCVGFRDLWFASLQAVHVMLEDGRFRRVPWTDIARVEGWSKKGKLGRRYSLGDGSHLFAVLDTVHDGLLEVEERCVRELSTCAPARKFTAIGQRIGAIGDIYEMGLVRRNRAAEQADGNRLLEVADMADRALARGALSDEDCDLIMRVAEEDRPTSSGGVGAVLRSVADRGLPVWDMILRLMECKSRHVRVTLVTAVWKGAPEAFLIPFYVKAIADTQQHHRYWAAARLGSAGQNVCAALRTQLEAAIRKEKSHEVKGALETALEHAQGAAGQA